MPFSTGQQTAAPIAIVGLGSVGRRHLKNLRALGCDNFVLVRSYQATLSDPELESWPSVSTFGQALAHQPRAVVISNPTARHVDVALEAAQAGCHLFIEKPLSHSLAGCSELAEVVARNRLVTMIGCQFRFHPLLVSLNPQLRAGAIGEVLGARAEWGEFLPDWHPWEDHRQSYSARGDLGGGVILTLIHPLDYLMWLLGAVRHARAMVRRVPSLQTATPDDWADILVEFECGVIGQVHLDYVQKPPVHSLTIWGDRGRATCDFHAGTLTWEMHDGSTRRERVPEDFERNTMFVEEMREFLQAIDQDRPSAIPLSEGIAVLQVALQAKQCALKEPCHG